MGLVKNTHRHTDVCVCVCVCVCIKQHETVSPHFLIIGQQEKGSIMATEPLKITDTFVLPGTRC